MHLTTKTRVLVGLGALVAAGAVRLWWVYPAHRIERTLAEPRMPAGVELTDEYISDNGWFCIDSCSWGSRYYVTTMPPKETADAIAAAMRDTGWTVEVTRCEEGCSYENAASPELVSVLWDVWFDGNGMGGSARVGRRGDGRFAVDLTTGT